MRSHVSPGANGFLPFALNIAPRRPSDPPPSGPHRAIPDGDRPARSGRPVLAVVSVAIFLFAVWVQVGRYHECRAAGGTVSECLLDP